MSQKLLITLLDSDVSPRFDLTNEVLVATLDEGGRLEESKTIVLAHESAEDLCQLILSEGVHAVICGGIAEEFYDYLVWKKIRVLDSVIGSWEKILEVFRDGRLQPGAILHDKKEKPKDV